METNMFGNPPPLESLVNDCAEGINELAKQAKIANELKALEIWNNANTQTAMWLKELCTKHNIRYTGVG